MKAYEVHKEKTFRNLKASLSVLRKIVETQRTQIRNLEHERDLFAEGYHAAVEKCDEFEANMRDQAAQLRPKQKN